jgi:hypothetical protein
LSEHSRPFSATGCEGKGYTVDALYGSWDDGPITFEAVAGRVEHSTATL